MVGVRGRGWWGSGGRVVGGVGVVGSRGRCQRGRGGRCQGW